MQDDSGVKIENHNEMHNCNVFMGVVNGGVFPLPGSQPVINNYYGDEEAKKLKNVQKEDSPKEETVFDEEERKKIMNDILKRFNFDDNQLGHTPQGKRVTNDDICLLFAKVFGLRGAMPSADIKKNIDVLWTLLADKRNQCFKAPGESFIRQTVLNILGAFAEKGLLCGAPMELAKSVFLDADAGIAKNITRGISSNVFPERTEEIINMYMEML